MGFNNYEFYDRETGTAVKITGTTPTQKTQEKAQGDTIPTTYIYTPSKDITTILYSDGSEYFVQGQITPPYDNYKVFNQTLTVLSGKYPKEEICNVYVPLYTAQPNIMLPSMLTLPQYKNTHTQDDYNTNKRSDDTKQLQKYSINAAEYTVDMLGNSISTKNITPALLNTLYQEYVTAQSKYTTNIPTYTEWLTAQRRRTDLDAYTQNAIDMALNIANSMQDAYTAKEIVDAGVVLEQTPLQTLADYPALAEILQANIPANVFTESKVAEATALTDAKQVAEQLGLPSLIEYLQMYTQAADTQNAATKQAIDLASAQLYDRLRKKDHEWLTSQTETASKKASTDTGTQAAALLETLANAKGEDLETIVKSFTDNLATAEEMQKALNEAYLTGQSQYDTGRLNIAQHTNDANAIAAQNLATIGALYEAAQQSENSFNKSKADYATTTQSINSAAQSDLVKHIGDILLEGQDADIQRKSIDATVQNILKQYTTQTNSDGTVTTTPYYTAEQQQAVLNILRASGLYDADEADEAQYTTEALKRLLKYTEDADDSFLIKDKTAQAVLDNKVINSVLFDPYEQARRTKTQTLDEYANSIGIQIDPRYYANLYDTAAVNAFKTYDTQRKYAENAMLRNLIAGDQSTNAPLRKRTMGAMSNNDRAVSAATQLSNMQNNATNNTDAIWSAYTAEKTAPAKEAAARSKASTDALAYYQNLMTNYDAGGTGGVLQQLNNANKNSADNLATYGSLAQQGMAGIGALNEANTSIANANADARATYYDNINTLNKNRSIQNLREMAFAKQYTAGKKLGDYNISIN